MGGPILLASPASRLLGDPNRLVTKLLEQLVLWVMVVLIIALVVNWEKQPLRSIGLQPFKWRSVLWGLALAASLILLTPVWANTLSRVGIQPSFESGFAKLVGLPLWFLVLAAVTAGVAEETLYRGYAVERLAFLTGSYWLGGTISLVIFTLAHVPVWGSGPLLIFLLSGGLITLFYVWEHDLLACIIAHAVTDTVGLISAVYLSQAR